MVCPKDGVTVTVRGEQKRYCGLLHALWALIRRGRESHLVQTVTPIEGTPMVAVHVLHDREATR